MATPSMIHARCAYSPRICNRNNKSPSQQAPLASSCSSSSSASNSSFSLSSGTNIGQRHQGLSAHAMSTVTHGNSISSIGNLKNDPDHLLVLVHGILASTADWTYAEAELKRRLGKNYLIYVSSSNTYTKTFTGIDGAGKRLADEVLQVVKKTRSLKRISFLSHSLGGLFARYAIAVLYSPDTYSRDQPGDLANNMTEYLQETNFSKGGLIAGLEPINFITLATPHLGVRGKKQLPFLLGVPILEKLAAPIAPFFVGQTGSQLFLTDGKPDKPPLLLRMASDCDDGKFLSALGTFRCRIIYANVSYDHMVGWRTSSIRRETELSKPPRQSLDGYKHVVDVEYCPPVPSDGPKFSPKAVQAKEAAQNAPNTQSTVEYHEIVEEEMIRGLQLLGWKKVDVSFHSAFWPFFAHNNIHVKNEWFHNAGVGVIAHVADSLKQQEASSVLSASL
ncbi:putative lipase C4A8.10 isoform X1 [Vigna radiata var. radiata]|uniref:Lipase C4A8.10 isoform X1 n=2 Tax=Vigna radiata var. radiata TaxID=3916 RepID=A0A1S3VYU0_VIGRR|nr:putative lipase C4A8.10 isoform X1 [Vigna radiata var. radiata]